MSHLRELGAVRHHVLVPVFPCSAWMLQGTGWKDPRGDSREVVGACYQNTFRQSETRKCLMRSSPFLFYERLKIFACLLHWNSSDFIMATRDPDVVVDTINPSTRRQRPEDPLELEVSQVQVSQR